MASPYVVCRSEEDLQRIVKNRTAGQCHLYETKKQEDNIGHYTIRFKDVGHPESKGALIECDRTPFIILNSEVYLCHQGPVRKKKKTVARDHTYSVSTRTIIKNTKKQDFPASIRKRRVVKFPDYKLFTKQLKNRSVKDVELEMNQTNYDDYDKKRNEKQLRNVKYLSDENKKRYTVLVKTLLTKSSALKK